MFIESTKLKSGNYVWSERTVQTICLGDTESGNLLQLVNYDGIANVIFHFNSQGVRLAEELPLSQAQQIYDRIKKEWVGSAKVLTFSR